MANPRARLEPTDERTLRIELSELVSPLGRVAIAVRPEGLCALDFAGHPVGPPIEARLQRALPWARFSSGSWSAPVIERLRAYFAGGLHALEGIEVAAIGTPFQQEVWRALRSIPVGTTATYAEVARRVGRPLAVRAVGAANRRNPVALVVPCHRVIASDGTLCGYASGLSRKAWLLEHERPARLGGGDRPPPGG